MERKRQRLDTEVGKKKDEINRIRKATEGLNKEISAVNAKLHRDKSSHDQMDKDNVLIQNEFVAMLKVRKFKIYKANKLPSEFLTHL